MKNYTAYRFTTVDGHSGTHRTQETEPRKAFNEVRRFYPKTLRKVVNVLTGKIYERTVRNAFL